MISAAKVHCYNISESYRSLPLTCLFIFCLSHLFFLYTLTFFHRRPSAWLCLWLSPGSTCSRSCCFDRLWQQRVSFCLWDSTGSFVCSCTIRRQCCHKEKLKSRWVSSPNKSDGTYMHHSVLRFSFFICASNVLPVIHVSLHLSSVNLFFRIFSSLKFLHAVFILFYWTLVCL